MSHSSVDSNVSMPANNAPTSMSPFFALPREIRDAIYSLCFLPGDYPFKALDNHFNIRLGHYECNPINHLPTWILASKQMLDEAMQQFYRDAACTILPDYPDRGRESGLLTLQHSRKLRLTWGVFVSLMEGGVDLEDRICMLVSQGSGRDKMAILPRLRAFGYEDRDVSIWFHALEYGRMTAQLREDGSPELGDFLMGMLMLQEPLDRIEFVVEELCADFKYYGDQNLANYEIVYSLFQKKLLDLAVNVVALTTCPERGYVVRDWVESEEHIFYREYDEEGLDPQRGTRCHWHLEVTRAAPGTMGKIVHLGQPTFRDAADESTHFANRKESEDGVVEWIAPGLGTRRVHVPRWLKQFTDRDVEIYIKEE